MATVASSSDQVAGSLEKLTLDSQAKSSKAYEPAKKDGYGDNSSFIYQQSYGFMPYGTYTASSSPLAMGYDAQMLQEYHYPSHYQVSVQSGRPSVTSQGSATQVEVSTSDANDLASLSVEANKGNSSLAVSGSPVSGIKAPKSLRPMYQKSAANSNGYYGRRGLATGNILSGYQDPTFNYDGIQSVPWLDASLSSVGQSKYAANSGGFSTHTNNLSSGGNQNLYTFPHLMNTSLTSGMGQALGYMNNLYPTYGHYGSTMRSGSAWSSFGYDSWKRAPWYNGSNYSKPRGYGYGKENSDGLSELNRGPRKGNKNQDGLGGWNPALSDSNKDNELPFIPDMEHYNKEDFPESYSDAKFFVIKSYSEDDVHKSIKYGVWSSTSNGNKKLDTAYREAKAKPDGCPVYLLFSVNTSGQFVGLAEMVGPVDFNKIVGYWQQDKWIGCFPVKWHIIKDVPNSLLRHITLENNENKPVTNSRDTQEVNIEQGIQILKIFKGHSSKTCILDDFEFYEARQKIMQEKKAKHQQLQKQVSDVKPSDGVSTGKDKVTVGKEMVEKSVEAALIEEPTAAVVMTGANGTVKSNGEVKSLEENGSVAVAEEASGKLVSAASAC